MTFVREEENGSPILVAMDDRASSFGRNWFLLALTFLAIAGSIGALLRLIYVVDLPWLVFKPWLHAHSHVAMLGWLFPAMLIALLGQDHHPRPRGFALWMGVSQLLVLGMLLSFPVQGYGPVPIACSVGQMIVSYLLGGLVWGQTRRWPARGSRLLVRLAFTFQWTSTLGVWAMGPIMEQGLAGSEWYYWSIQWFLHFQFNGWLWFAVMAVGSRWAERHGVDVHLDTTTVMLWALGTVLTYALAIAWIERHAIVIAINSIGVAFQAVAAWRTLLRMRAARVQALVRTTRWMRVLIGVMLMSMAVKVAAQSLVALPAVATMALTLRNYVVGFVHLNTLGTATTLLFAHAVMKGWFPVERRSVRIGLIGFVLGYAASELLLFTQGTCFWAGWGLLPGYYWTLFGASVIMALGISSLLINGIHRAASAHPLSSARHSA